MSSDKQTLHDLAILLFSASSSGFLCDTHTFFVIFFAFTALLLNVTFNFLVNDETLSFGLWQIKFGFGRTVSFRGSFAIPYHCLFLIRTNTNTKFKINTTSTELSMYVPKLIDIFFFTYPSINSAIALSLSAARIHHSWAIIGLGFKNPGIPSLQSLEISSIAPSCFFSAALR